MQAVADEIAQHAAPTLRSRLPAPQAQTRYRILHVPGRDDVAQTPQRAVRNDGLRALPARQLGKIEVDDGRATALLRRGQHGERAGEIGCKRLFHEYRLAP